MAAILTKQTFVDRSKTAANSALGIGGVSSPLDSFVVTESSVLRTSLYAEKPVHRQSAKRSQSGIMTTLPKTN